MFRATHVHRTWRAVPLAVAVLLSLTTLVGANPPSHGPWGDPQPVVSEASVPADARVNTESHDGCPIEAPDGLHLFIASPRPGTMGGNDIWVAERPNIGAAWGPMVNLGAPVNSQYHDFCPTPLVGGWLLFVSDRPGCGAAQGANPPIGDIYITQQLGNGTWREPQHLGCSPNGPNFTGGEFGPSLVHTVGGTYLYFSSTGTTGQHDIYRSRLGAGGRFGPAEAVTELNDPEGAVDQMPNLSRDGMEIVFASNRDGTMDGIVTGSMDIWTATFDRATGLWSTPVPVAAVNRADAPETRPSLSADGHRLYFGRGNPADVYVSTR